MIFLFDIQTRLKYFDYQNNFQSIVVLEITINVNLTTLSRVAKLTVLNIYMPKNKYRKSIGVKHVKLT